MSRSHGYRCYLEPGAWGGDRLELSADETKHLAHVLRATAGDQLTVFDGVGSEASARIASIDGERATLEIIEQHRAPVPKIQLSLVQGLPRRATMDLIVQKATELGVARIEPLLTERTVARIPASKRGERSRRWQRIAIEAAKQCGSPRVPEIRGVEPLEAWAARGPGDRVVVLASLAPAAPPLADLLKRLKGATSVALVIGPEGDFSEAEMERLRAVGALECRFGEQVFRSDTAALYGLSVLHHLLGAGEFVQDQA